ncbi:TPA: hypothetical protein ACRR3W_003128 [Providencia stuartii]
MNKPSYYPLKMSVLKYSVSQASVKDWSESMIAGRSPASAALSGGLWRDKA